MRHLLTYRAVSEEDVPVKRGVPLISSFKREEDRFLNWPASLFHTWQHQGPFGLTDICRYFRRCRLVALEEEFHRVHV